MLEIIIAIFLLVICAMPVLSSLMTMNKVLNDDIRANQREHIENLVFATIVEALQNHTISWSDLIKSKRENVLTLDKNEELVKLLKQVNYAAFYQVKIADHKAKRREAKPRTVAVLLEIDIEMEDLSNAEKNQKSHKIYHYEHFIFARKELQSNEKISISGPVADQESE